MPTRLVSISARLKRGLPPNIGSIPLIPAHCVALLR